MATNNMIKKHEGRELKTKQNQLSFTNRIKQDWEYTSRARGLKEALRMAEGRQ